MKKIAIHSGKGGVGKTFISINIAYSLSGSVGLIDADVDCPNVSKFLLLNSMLSKINNRIIPIIHNNVKIVSSDLFNPMNEDPLIIRGPIKHRILVEFLNSVEWGHLDYQIIDLPPGTADVPLSAMQLSAIDGLILVTTPLKESILDTTRAANMAKKLGIKIIGLIENMSGEIFGTNGSEIAKKLQIPFLGSIPLSQKIAKINQEGKIAFLENSELFELRDKIVSEINSFSK